MDDKVVVTEVGARTINESSKKRKRTDVTAVVGDCFHKSCRSSYTNTRAIDQHLRFLVKQNEFQRISNRLLEQFDFKTDGLFCSSRVVFEKTHKKENSFRVHTTEFGETLVGLCQKRNDQFCEKVHGRILATNLDLHTVAAVYRKTYYCTSNLSRTSL